MLNVYASTEAGTLFASRGDEFTIETEIQASIAIQNGELLIHKDLLAKSDVFDLNGEWYHSGDLVEVINNLLKIR